MDYNELIELGNALQDNELRALNYSDHYAHQDKTIFKHLHSWEVIEKTVK